MDVKLDGLIEKIRAEAVEEGKRRAEEIVAAGRREAASIVEEAKREAERLVAEAERRGADFRRNAESAVQQAARDVELQLKERITALFDRVLKTKVGEVMGPEFLKELILKMAGGLSADKGVNVILGAAEVEKLKNLLQAGTREELHRPVVLRAGNVTAGGFRIGIEGEDVYYDFTTESVAEALRSFLNPALKNILDSKNG
jgi:V/A-type H+/Na+-transporting ATPase subunit E